jgi:lysozyme
MQASEHAFALIRAFEGFRAAPYRCAAGVWTIGYGHTTGISATTEFISKARAELLLQHDVKQCEQVLWRMVSVPLRQHQYDALISFVFNLGAGALQRSTLRQKLNRGDHESAAEEFSKWVFANGVKLPGLVRRREAEKQLFKQEPMRKK